MCLVDNKSSLKDFMKLVAEKINGFAGKSVKKSFSSTRYIAVFEILIVCYRMIPTEASFEEIKKHIAKRYC